MKSFNFFLLSVNLKLETEVLKFELKHISVSNILTLKFKKRSLRKIQDLFNKKST